MMPWQKTLRPYNKRLKLKSRRENKTLASRRGRGAGATARFVRQF
jgi:hypothetical protein